MVPQAILSSRPVSLVSLLRPSGTIGYYLNGSNEYGESSKVAPLRGSWSIQLGYSTKENGYPKPQNPKMVTKRRKPPITGSQENLTETQRRRCLEGFSFACSGLDSGRAVWELWERDLGFGLSSSWFGVCRDSGSHVLPMNPMITFSPGAF